MKLRERDLEIDFTNAIDAIVFDQMKADQPGYHGIGQMHRVDFVVELEEAILFVEVKDPGNPKAQALFNLAYEFNDLRTHNRLETYVCYPQKLANVLTSSTQECAQKQDFIRDHSLIYGPAPVTALRELQERFPETWSVPSYIPSLAIRWICADEAASRALATATYSAFVATVQAMASGESTRKLARFYAAA